jgi:hypothetical protein
MSEALALVDARCLITGGFSAGGEWALRFWPQARLKLAVAVNGRCWVTADGVAEPILIEQGDVAVLNDRQSVVLSGSPGQEPMDSRSLFGPGRDRVVKIGTGRVTVIIGGHVELNRGGEDLLLSAPPPLTHIRSSTTEAPVLQWLLGQLLREMRTQHSGAEFAAQHLSQLLFVEVLRTCLAGSPAFPPGVAAGAGRRPARPGAAADARQPGACLASSGAVTVRRDVPDHLRRALPHHGGRSAADLPAPVADAPGRAGTARGGHPNRRTRARAGYTSESAFSTAFKRTAGVAPKRYRDNGTRGPSPT